MNGRPITTRAGARRRPDRARDEQRASFARQHSPAMLAGVRRLVAGDAMAIEVVRDALDRAWSLLPLFRPSPMLMASWLQGLSAGCAVARLRANHPRAGAAVAEASGPATGGPTGFDPASEPSPALRAASILIESEGLTPDDAARLLGIEPHVVWARLRRARRSPESTQAESTGV